MRIGEVAALAKVPAATVRYYERRGLIGAVPRSPSGYRQYDPDTARRLCFIKHAQELGFSLNEIQDLLALRIADPASCPRVEATAREKIRRIRLRIQELERIERTLEGLVRSCRARRRTAECRILAVLTEDETEHGDHGPRITRPVASSRSR